jgi:hypothetical protein
MGDRRKCQTYTASPAEPGGLPVMLAFGWCEAVDAAADCIPEAIDRSLRGLACQSAFKFDGGSIILQAEEHRRKPAAGQSFLSDCCNR